MDLVVHKVFSARFRKLRSAAGSKALCGTKTESVTADSERVTCKRCINIAWSMSSLYVGDRRG